MEKIKVTEKDKEEFKKTVYGKKCYDTFVLFVILLLVSCVVAGFLTGYGESGKELFKHQNMVLLVTVIVAILSAEQLGKCEGALNQFVIAKKNNEKKEKESEKPLVNEEIKVMKKDAVKTETALAKKESVTRKTSKGSKKTADKKESPKKKVATKVKSSTKAKNEK